MDKRRRTPNKRNQPSRQTRAQAGGVEDVLLDVLQELKTLKEEVKDLKERQNSTEGESEKIKTQAPHQQCNPQVPRPDPQLEQMNLSLGLCILVLQLRDRLRPLPSCRIRPQPFLRWLRYLHQPSPWGLRYLLHPSPWWI